MAFVWQCISQTYLPMKPYYAELVFGGISFMVVRELNIASVSSLRLDGGVEFEL